MYCSACGSPLAAGLSYCNRCGMSLKKQSESTPTVVSSYLTAITLIGVGGLSLMLGGAIALKSGAQFGEEMVGIFMLMCFLIVSLVELFLCRQLSRISRAEHQTQLAPPTTVAPPIDYRAPQPRALAEPLSNVSSVTENTTRTLEYSRNEPLS